MDRAVSIWAEKVAALSLLILIVLASGVLLSFVRRRLSLSIRVIWTYVVWDIQLIFIFFYPLLPDDSTMAISEQIPDILIVIPMFMLMPFVYSLGIFWFIFEVQNFIRIFFELSGTLILAILLVHFALWVRSSRGSVSREG